MPGERRGCYRRAILLDGDDGYVRAELEDDFHRFGVTVHHDGRTITKIEGRAGRTPWTTCPASADRLTELVGKEIAPGAPSLNRQADARWQCTHLFDLAKLAADHAHRGVERRFYQAEVEDERDGRRKARLRRNGQLIVEWDLAGSVIIEGEFAGADLSNLTNAIRQHPDSDVKEAAFVLRRAIHISSGRRIDLDSIARADQIGLYGTCYSFQPEIAIKADRRVGTSRDFSDTPDAPLQEERRPEDRRDSEAVS